jgi:hypothetical protein
MTDVSSESSKGIYGADASRIMSGEWKSLWAVKTGRSQLEKTSDLLDVKMAAFTTPFNRQWFTAQTDIELKMDGIDHLAHPKIPHMRASLDGLTSTGAVFEAIHVSQSLNIQKVQEKCWWRMIHNMMVAETDEGYMSVFFGNSKWDYAVLNLDSYSQETLTTWEAEFWEHVLNDEEPKNREGITISVQVLTRY